jgi:hypothetical protein
MALVCLIAVITLSGSTFRFATSATTASTLPSFARLAGGIRFAIADFDGDWKPDLAEVETSDFHHFGSNYSVRLHLSASADVSFLVNAPTGGIRLAARDVNGDNLPDLVVSSILDQRVVAVLLNEGHGQFSRAEPAFYLTLAADPDVFLRSSNASIWDNLTLAPARYSFEGECANGSAIPAVPGTGPVIHRNEFVLQIAAIRGRRGRSPPVLSSNSFIQL